MWARRVRYDSHQFAAELKALVTPPRAVVAHVGQRGLDDIELPDLTDCDCEFSAERIKSVGAALYYRELARFGAIEAIDNLGKKFTTGEVDLGDAGTVLYPYLIDRANRDRDEEFQKIAEAPFADGRIERLITELLTTALELDEGEAHEKSARKKVFNQTARDCACAVNEAGGGILSLAAPDMVAELSTGLQVLGSDDVQCAIGGPTGCGGSVPAAIEALTPNRARPPREEVAAKASVGREVINMLAEKPRNARWRRKVIKLAYRGLREQPQLTQQPRRRELARVTGDSAESNGTGIVTLSKVPR